MRSADGLSTRQQDILKYIQGFVEEQGYPPTIRQIQESLNISSTSVVAYNLRVLETKSLLKRVGKVSRGITIPQTTPVQPSLRNGFQVPVLGVITAGQPLPNPEDTSSGEAELVDVPEDVAPPERLSDVYALRVRGHSMIDALIDDGDVVLLRYQETAENGQMVAALIEDDNAVTLKRFYKEGDRVRLQPANVTMDPIYVNADKVRIQGRVVGVMRSLYY
ncbi:MAG: transcriptional repressor LexA [Chloroflexi bacterium AL-W]|nr:transcriptional repressor LexA [Chloroflexi bacterium AL-N1]NOK65050.1 transcriptional repressor LexA [Chloroflexi bacterium AL-N10]NOK72683.1 transcriptional repressor LexA [Chloroflexi bacterium AL-N5]NOK79229.1 transcriptional repressor LexA [Chloroflexi bacterium AL-W]NOK87145.1 transcriptional repressor LexA [Chloroflexi bacterium AL-N15]